MDRYHTEIRRTRLLYFLQSAKFHLKKIDKIMTMEESNRRGRLMAEECNRFNFDLDSFAHTDCKVPLDKLQSMLKKSFRLMWK